MTQIENAAKSAHKRCELYQWVLQAQAVFRLHADRAPELGERVLQELEAAESHVPSIRHAVAAARAGAPLQRTLAGNHDTLTRGGMQLRGALAHQNHLAEASAASGDDEAVVFVQLLVWGTLVNTIVFKGLGQHLCRLFLDKERASKYRRNPSHE